jgi:hypothetical protein
VATIASVDNHRCDKLYGDAANVTNAATTLVMLKPAREAVHKYQKRGTANEPLIAICRFAQAREA